jgi:hypothetical protein
MPRQIIDVETSKPAYERRRRRQFIVILAIVIIIIAAVWFLTQRVHAEESHLAAGTLEKACCLSLV